MDELEKPMQINSLSIIDNVDLSMVQNTLTKISQLQVLVQSTLQADHDYGVIPGTTKPTLYKPGAEKIGMLFGLNPEYEFLERTEDYKSEFFAYDMKCTLYKNGNPVAQGVGNCNSKETKYRYQNVHERDIPEGIDKSTLKCKTDKYGITKYQIENPEVCSLVNTILKMAKKRAYIDATLQVAALSEIFTQDLEDLMDLLENEQTETMTVEEAAAIKVTFGKNKGKTLGEIYKTDQGWIDWFLNKADKKDPVIEKAIGILSHAAEEHKKAKANKADNIESQGPELEESEEQEFLKDLAFDAEFPEFLK